MILAEISSKIRKNASVVEAWFEKKESALTLPLFVSCDIRHSGHKIAVVDTNLFPAGFNNLCNTFTQRAIDAAKSAVDERFQGVQRVLLLSESHTRNKFYFENLWHLSHILEGAGLSVRIGMIEPDFDEPLIVTLTDDKKVAIYPIREKTVSHQKITWADFTPEIIFSNNDFSKVLPSYWNTITQAIIPPPTLGWLVRRKSRHFAFANALLKEFGALIEVNPWHLSCHFDAAQEMDLNNPKNLEALSYKTQTLLATIQGEYVQHDISETPYLFLKSDSGTYGMGVTTLYSADELATLNRKARTKILSSKGGTPNTNFILQEGIPTDDFYSEQPLEPVIYLINGQFAGGFFRLNPTRDAYVSLNSPGMRFACLCLHKLDEPHEWPFIKCAEKEDLIAVSTTLARIATLAAGMEDQKFLLP